MNRCFKSITTIALVFLMLVQMSEVGIVNAVESIDKALNPAEQIELTVPEKLRDGSNYCFIRQDAFQIGEKSAEKLYIPIQRSGELDAEADVTLKVIDLSAHHGVNYAMQIYKDNVEPEMEFGDVALVDLVQNAEEQAEFEPIDEDTLGEIVYEQGGAELLDAEGNPLGVITAQPLDENGNPIPEEPVEASEEATVENDIPATDVDALRGARDAYTGITSDRQELAASDTRFSAPDEQSAPEASDPPLIEEDYPGKEYRLHFDAGEAAKFLVITPLYSEAADGDSQIMLLLKDPSENLSFPEEYGPSVITILDEDEPEPVKIHMAASTVYASDGKAAITVTREGRINAIVGVHLASWDGSAKVNDDYGGVSANLYFPMGITERTVELPVGQGGTEKDFYVTITPVTDCTIGTATTRVVIPAAVLTDEAELMAKDEVKLADALNLRNLTYASYGRLFEYRSDFSIKATTRIDKEFDPAGFELNLPQTYFYDGFRMKYDFYLNFCDGSTQIATATELDNKGKPKWSNYWSDDIDDGGYHGGRSKDYYYGSAKAPKKAVIKGVNVDNEGTIFNDSYLDLYVNSLQPILRRFNITVEQPEALAFEGMDEAAVRAEYETYVVNDQLGTTFSVWSGDNFSITRSGRQEYARLVGIEAVKSNGDTYRLSTIDGSTDTATVYLNENLIDALAEGGFITWSHSKTSGMNADSYTGSIRVRPIFDYLDVTVSVKENPYGTLQSNGKALEPGTYLFHAGDKLTLSTEISATGKLAGLSPAGFDYSLTDGKNGAVVDPGGVLNYKDGALVFKLTGMSQDGGHTGSYYRLEPTFTETKNQVVVKVSQSDLAYFDTEQGLFDTADKWLDGSTWSYRVAADVLSNEIFELWAIPKDPTHVPVWTTAQDSTNYSGNAFYLNTGVKASDNVVTLRIDRAESSHAYYSISGAVYSQMRNLSTGHTVDKLIEAEGALLSAGLNGALSDTDGAFTLAPQLLVGGTTLRYTVTYNGAVSIQEVKLPSASVRKESVTYYNASGQEETVQAVRIGSQYPEIPSYCLNGAHFESVYVEQDGLVTGVISALQMNGKKVKIQLKVDPGTQYAYMDQSCTETVKDVTLYFQSQLTGEIHGVYSTADETLDWDADTNTATLTIQRFSPDQPDKFAAGDTLYAVLTTDKKVGLAAWTDGDMVYDPVSTGVGVYSDMDYEPESFRWDPPISAESFLFVDPDEPTNSDGSTRYSYGKFPFIGEITAAIHVFTFLKTISSYSPAEEILDDLEDADSDDEGDMDDGLLMDDEESGQNRYRALVSVAFRVKETPYGGVRFMLAVAVGSGTGAYKNSQMNPYSTKESMREFLNFNTNVTDKTGALLASPNSKKDQRQMLKSVFGGPYISFNVFVGLYLDYGYIAIAKTDGSGDTETSHDMVFMGAGGFIGAKLTGGWTWPFLLGPAPAYLNIEGAVDVTLYLGASADPNKTLASFYENKHHEGQDFGFNLELYGNVKAAGTFGIGLYKVTGIRASVGLGLELGYSPKMEDWFPKIGTPYGVTTDITFSGNIDLAVTSIPLWSFSWPLPLSYGFMEFFQQTRRGNTLISILNTAIDDGDGSEAVRAECRRLSDELAACMDSFDATGEELRQKVNNLQEYAYKNGVINWAEYQRANMIRAGGVAGGIIDFVMMEDETPKTFLIRDHVQSEWVADESGELMEAFQPVSSKALMENAIAQPSSQILSIGGNKFLMVFLDDDSTRDTMQASVLKYTIYDATNDTWSVPQVVQKDKTADSKPNLVDAGDRLILSWASISDEKYQRLRQDLAKEQHITITDTEQINAALEADPARVMAQMDIFTVEFDKSSKTFGTVVQLTDDDYYDDYPLAVYDTETKDYIILYYKTAQDTENYTSADDKLLDLVNPYAADKTYSVLCYMLYNGTQEADDPQPVGWVRDYLYPNETELTQGEQASFLAQWGGQRFLPSALRDADGGQTDPPIADLTACPGYNGLAAYAFTVDKDLDLDTSEDKELFLQFYDFSEHSTYVPIRIAGDIVEEKIILPEDRTQSGYSTAEVTTPVEVGAPKLVRNGGSTWLFWRENNDGLRYVNVSELLCAKVSETEYAVHADGTLAESYQLHTQKVDFGSQTTDEEMHITDYQVITDGDDNLYVIWNDTTAYETTDEVTGEPATGSALEIYATAKIREPELTTVEADGTTTTPVRWSKPYRLTRDNQRNDGMAIALDEDGNLIIVHNQYEMLLADTEAKQAKMIERGQAGLREVDGKLYLVGSPYYNSDIRLMVTRCAPVGSLEATEFLFSDSNPVAGETVDVTAIVENTGLTAAHGCTAEFYEYKNGVQGKKIATVTSDEIIPVNSAKKTSFEWVVPAGGVDGYRIQAVIREKQPNGAYYDAVESFSDTFAAAPVLVPTLDSCVQNGDMFDVRYTVKNTGNQPAKAGTTANLCLLGLYGDLQERYGVDDALLVGEDISNLAPGATRTVTKRISIPVSVFKFCGYDAVEVIVSDKEDHALAYTDQQFITLSEPMHLRLNEGNPLYLASGSTKAVTAAYDSTVFMDTAGKIIYRVDDSSIARVDAEGNVTALGAGTTTLTATLLPSGTSTSIPLTVSGDPCPKDNRCPLCTFNDLDVNAWYHDGVHWALENGVMNGMGNKRFAPNTAASRAMIVTMLWRMEGSPRVDYELTFRDVATDQWYTEAIRWAARGGIVTGYSTARFGPNVNVSREQLVTMLYRYAKYKGMAADAGETAYLNRYTDAKDVSEWAVKAFRWAVDAGMIQGIDSSTLRPRADATRAQVATVLMRYDGCSDK